MTRMGARRTVAWCASASIAAALACGEVPTLADGIAFLAPIELPAPAVALGDTLRDSLGRVTPLRVVAFDRDNNRLPSVTATFVVIAAPAGVRVSPVGIVTAQDSAGTLRLVARVGDRLQTTETTLLVVPQPDSIAITGTPPDSVASPGISAAMQVTVTGIRRGSRVPVQGIVVRYQITRVGSSTSVDSTRFRLLDETNNSLRRDPRLAVDTTNSAGVAERRLTVVTGQRGDSVRVLVTATSLRGAALRGSPLAFSIPIR